MKKHGEDKISVGEEHQKSFYKKREPKIDVQPI